MAPTLVEGSFDQELTSSAISKYLATHLSVIGQDVPISLTPLNTYHFFSINIKYWIYKIIRNI
jgi:hypothetical protein